MSRRPSGVIGARFWEGLVRRYRRGGSWLRPRTTLVFQRGPGLVPERGHPTGRHSAATALSLHFHLHLGWPAWLRAAPAPAGIAASLGFLRGWTPGLRSASDQMGSPLVARRAAGGLSAVGTAIGLREPTRARRPGRVPALARVPASVHGSVRASVADSALGNAPGSVLGRFQSPGRAYLALPAIDRRLSKMVVETRLALLVRAGGAGVAAGGVSPGISHGIAPQITHLLARREETGSPGWLGRRLGSEVSSPSAGARRGDLALRLVQRYEREPAPFPRAARTLAQPLPAHPAPSIPHLMPPPSSAQSAARHQPQPQLDLARLSDEVYRQIERRVRIERERRGI